MSHPCIWRFEPCHIWTIFHLLLEEELTNKQDFIGQLGARTKFSLLFSLVNKFEHNTHQNPTYTYTLIYHIHCGKVNVCPPLLRYVSMSQRLNGLFAYTPLITVLFTYPPLLKPLLRRLFLVRHN